MYSVASYGKMIAEGPRVNAYVEALRRVVKPESVVVDMGSGPGFFALLACQLGAKRVYAIEPDNVVELARRAAITNGFADRLVCIQDFSSRVKLLERADIIVSDLRGVLPWFQHHLPSICDARLRLLKPGGSLISARDLIWASLISAPEKYEELTGVWKADLHDIDFRAGRSPVVNSWIKFRPKPEQLLVEPVLLHTLDYGRVESPDVNASINWKITKSGTAHGALLWFDTELMPGIGFSNHPAKPELVYGSAFFPFSSPIELQNGDEIGLTIKADLVEDDYVWRWSTSVGAPLQEPRISFKQSSFYSVPLSIAQLKKKAAAHIPNLNENGRLTAFVLSQMNGNSSLQQIADQIVMEFPERIKNRQQALTTVADISQKYSDD